MSSTLDHLYNKYQVDTPDTLFSQCIRNPTQFTNVIHYYRGQLHDTMLIHRLDTLTYWVSQLPHTDTPRTPKQTFSRQTCSCNNTGVPCTDCLTTALEGCAYEDILPILQDLVSRNAPIPTGTDFQLLVEYLPATDIILFIQTLKHNVLLQDPQIQNIIQTKTLPGDQKQVSTLLTSLDWNKHVPSPHDQQYILKHVQLDEIPSIIHKFDTTVTNYKIGFERVSSDKYGLLFQWIHNNPIVYTLLKHISKDKLIDYVKMVYYHGAHDDVLGYFASASLEAATDKLLVPLFDYFINERGLTYNKIFETALNQCPRSQLVKLVTVLPNDQITDKSYDVFITQCLHKASPKTVKAILNHIITVGGTIHQFLINAQIKIKYYQ